MDIGNDARLFLRREQDRPKPDTPSVTANNRPGLCRLVP